MDPEKRKTVLIVDDQEMMVNLLRRHVANAGYAFVIARNGVEAVKSLETTIPDLVLLDVMMPDMNGFEACRRLRAHPSMKRTPIIVLTSLHARSDSEDAQKSGASEFMNKPVDAEVLAKRLRYYLGSPFKF